MNRIVLPMLVLGFLRATVACGCSANQKQEGADQESGRNNREEREKAIAEIKKLGGQITVDERSPDKPVVSVAFGESKVTLAIFHRGNLDLRWA